MNNASVLFNNTELLNNNGQQGRQVGPGLKTKEPIDKCRQSFTGYNPSSFYQCVEEIQIFAIFQGDVGALLTYRYPDISKDHRGAATGPQERDNVICCLRLWGTITYSRGSSTILGKMKL